MPLPEMRVVSARPEGVVLARRGAVVGIRRAPLQGPVLTELRGAIEELGREHPGGLALLSAFRLSPRFPITLGFDSNVDELGELLKVLDHHIAASAHLCEFGGVRAAAMRLASSAVLVIARPRCEMGSFDRLTDAIAWLAPHARRAGVPDDPPTYVGLYQQADRMLREMDAPGVAVLPSGDERT